MCRLALKTASEPFSPYEVLQAMEAMQEGYDGSGLGLLLRGLEFEDFRYRPVFPILSGVAKTKAYPKKKQTRSSMPVSQSALSTVPTTVLPAASTIASILATACRSRWFAYRPASS